uniref:Uncharacterized protein n=1 Tax=Ciona savignyi TaxID=51511 RepID=H2Z1W7_CIOSA
MFKSCLIVDNLFVFPFLVCLRFMQCTAFNLEDRLPLIKVGPAGSLFGLSVAQHHIVANITNIDDAVLMVGAPTADRENYHSPDAYKP